MVFVVFLDVDLLTRDQNPQNLQFILGETIFLRNGRESFPCEQHELGMRLFYVTGGDGALLLLTVHNKCNWTSHTANNNNTTLCLITKTISFKKIKVKRKVFIFITNFNSLFQRKSK